MICGIQFGRAFCAGMAIVVSAVALARSAFTIGTTQGRLFRVLGLMVCWLYVVGAMKVFIADRVGSCWVWTRLKLSWFVSWILKGLLLTLLRRGLPR